MTIFSRTPTGKHGALELTELGYEEFHFPLLYYNGHGIRESFHLYKNNRAVGKISLSTSFEAYSPRELNTLNLDGGEPRR